MSYTYVTNISGYSNFHRLSIGKFPHLAVRHGKQHGHNILLDYADVPVGEIREKNVEITNVSNVSRVS